MTEFVDGGNIVLKNIKHGIVLNRYTKEQEIRIEKRKCVHLHSLSDSPCKHSS